MNLKFLILILLLSEIHAYSQRTITSTNIAETEKRFAAKTLESELTLASNNYTVNYYRCEWKIDPAKNYIEGKVTTYFIITATTNALVFDLSHQLKVDSVLMRAKKLSILQGADETLTI